MHKLLLDQNLSYKILNEIKEFFPQSSHVRLLHLEKAEDLKVWQYAKEHGFHILTKDTDFQGINVLYGFPPKTVRIHIGNTSTKYITELILRRYKLIQEFLESKDVGCLELE